MKNNSLLYNFFLNNRLYLLHEEEARESRQGTSNVYNWALFINSRRCYVAEIFSIRRKILFIESINHDQYLLQPLWKLRHIQQTSLSPRPQRLFMIFDHVIFNMNRTNHCTMFSNYIQNHSYVRSRTNAAWFCISKLYLYPSKAYNNVPL